MKFAFQSVPEPSLVTSIVAKMRNWWRLRRAAADARQIPTRQFNAREIDTLLANLREAGVGL